MITAVPIAITPATSATYRNGNVGTKKNAAIRATPIAMRIIRSVEPTFFLNIIFPLVDARFGVSGKGLANHENRVCDLVTLLRKYLLMLREKAQ